MVILAQDPSFRALAFSLYDGKNTIYLDNCEFSLGECVGFEKVFNANISIFEQYKDKLESDYGVNKELFVDKIISEIPPPNGSYSAGLFSLDTLILYKLWEMNTVCSEIWTLPPSFLMMVHNTRKYSKTDSVTVAKYFMQDVLKDDFEFVMKRGIGKSGKEGKPVLNADRAESLIFLLKAFCMYDINGCKGKILNTISGFFSESEKLLISR